MMTRAALHDSVTIKSYVDQVLYGKPDAARASAALALGNLSAFLTTGPKKACAAAAAHEHGIWDVLLDVLVDEASSTVLLEAIHVALANLFTPDKAEASQAWGAISQAAQRFLQEHVLAHLAGHLRSAAYASRSTGAIARCISSLCQHMHVLPKHEAALLDSGLVEMLLYKISHASMKDGALCAVAAMALARSTPGLFRAIVCPTSDNTRLATTSQDQDASQQDPGLPDWQPSEYSVAETEIEQPDLIAGTSAMYNRLCQLYCAAIKPGQQVWRTRERDSEIEPGDVATLFLRCMELDPWAKFDDGSSKDEKAALALESLLASQALGCMMSYLVVESGNVRHVLSGLCKEALEFLEGMQAPATSELGKERERLQLLKDELKGLKRNLSSAEELGRLEEPWALKAAERAHEVALQGRILKYDIAAMESRLKVVSDSLGGLQEWSKANARVGGKVRRTPAHTKVMMQVVSTVTQLANPQGGSAAVSKRMGKHVTWLQKQAQTQMLATGLLPCAGQLFNSSQAALQLLQRMAALLQGLGIRDFLIAKCTQVAAALEACEQRIVQVAGRVRYKLSDIHASMERMARKSATQGADDQMLEEAHMVGWELVGLTECDQQLKHVLSDISHYTKAVQEVAVKLQQAGKAADKVLGAVPDLFSTKRTTDVTSRPATRAGREHDTQPGVDTKSADQPGPVTWAFLRHLSTQLMPSWSDRLSTLRGRDIVMHELDKLTSGTNLEHTTPVSSDESADSKGSEVLTEHLVALVRKSGTPQASSSPRPLSAQGSKAGGLGAHRSGNTDAELHILAMLELQLHVLWDTVQKASALGAKALNEAADEAWQAVRCRQHAAAVRQMLHPRLRPLAPKPALPPLLTHPEYHSLPGLLTDREKLQTILPRAYYTLLCIQSHLCDCGIVGSVVDAARDGQAVRSWEARVCPPPPAPVEEPAPVDKASKRPGTTPAAATGRGHGTARATAAKQKKDFESMYTNVVFTMSPVKGCAPKGATQGKRKMSDAELGFQLGAFDGNTSIVEQCDAVITGACSAVMLALGIVVPAPPEGQAGAAAAAGTQELISHVAISKWGSLRHKQHTVLDTLVHQGHLLNKVLNDMVELAGLMHSLCRQACCLPGAARVSWTCVPPQELHRWMIQLHTCFALSLSTRPADRESVLNAITQAASQCVTTPGEYASVYLDTGIIKQLLALLHSSTARGKHAAKQDDAAATQVVSRYGLDVSSVPRPNALVARIQSASARALLAIGRNHPEAFTSIISEDAPANIAWELVLLGSDHSLPLECRLAAAHVLACCCTLASRQTRPYPRPVSARDSYVSFSQEGLDTRSPPPVQPTQRVTAEARRLREEVLRSGAFSMFLDVMSEDHRQLDPHATKAAVVDAIAEVAADPDLCEHVINARPPTGNTSHAVHGEASDLSSPRNKHQPGLIRPETSLMSTAAHSKVKDAEVPERSVELFEKFKNTDQILWHAAQALWSAPSQLYMLMSSDRTKRGKYVSAETVGPLNRLSLLATQTLVWLADEEPESRRMLQRMGVAKRINIVFLQAIKDVELHHVLLDLRDKVAVRQEAR